MRLLASGKGLAPRPTDRHRYIGDHSRPAHNPEVAGSNPVPATNRKRPGRRPGLFRFLTSEPGFGRSGATVPVPATEKYRNTRDPGDLVAGIPCCLSLFVNGCQQRDPCAGPVQTTRAEPTAGRICPEIPDLQLYGTSRCGCSNGETAQITQVQITHGAPLVTLGDRMSARRR
jgi:hypothetical protein